MQLLANRLRTAMHVPRMEALAIETQPEGLETA